ncbi:tyrosine-type recombinase/integrase [Arcobacter arenosus]|uniref:Site-specific integrase n=1 Tax=Arcobacter arenosus TaxID=2576037 RepID=A0A5R8XY61_9BACT|nr:tyrosine-type recombinase/integrase [Arcobacter arenosus]TLP36156.1 site-specific integrase [Arcobacter arenosus]
MASIYTYRNILHMNVRVDGKQHRKSTGLTDTKENRLKVQLEIMPNFVNSLKYPTSDIKLEFYIKKFLEGKKHLAKEVTYKRYKNTIDKWILNQYGKKKVTDINYTIAKNYIHTQYNLNKTAKSVELYITIFSGILQEAVFDGVITNNPFKSIKKRKKKKPIIVPFSADEVRLLLENTTGWLHNYIGLASHTGLRSGEMLALKWSNIDDKYIYIRATRDRGIDTEPKTVSSVRDIPIFDTVRGFIQKQRELTGHLEYVFNSKLDEPWCHTGSICEFHWYPLLDRLGLKRRRIYELRHTFATNMLNSGYFKVTEIAHLMGHTTTEYLFNVYSKFIESEKDRIPLDKSIY